ncbi:MAG TPA: iron-containing alcohol dehydrogenase [Methylomirabilota bacterium]|nr:iron-containing alcohol dehydrogenase [Methylomirabilota bacterium]
MTMPGADPVSFEFATATRIVFGAGQIREAGNLSKSMGARAWVVTGRNPERAAPLLDSLKGTGIVFELSPIEGEPTIGEVSRAVVKARRFGAELVIGFGGGSALDAGKAIAALVTNEGDSLDYLEVIGMGRPLAKAPLPCIAIPTTAGTGAEVTRNAVLASPEHRVKVSLRSPLMLPRVALVDPALTHGLPAGITSTTGMDALTQLIEPYVSCRSNPFTDAICREGLRRAARSLERAVRRGEDPTAREDMALASLFGGLALANAGLGAVHGFAAPIGGMFPAPHGAVCAVLLPHAMRANVTALRQREPSHEALERFAEIARLLTGRVDATADDGVRWVEELGRRIGIEPLRRFQITEGEVPAIVEKAARASSMKGNPISLTEEELAAILRAAL